MISRTVLLFASTITMVYAGISLLNPEEEAEAVRLWQEFCAGELDHGTDGDALIYCKKTQEHFEESLEHNIEVTALPDPPKQVIFVEPPTYHYRHNIILNGKSGQPHNTTIYVLPQKNNHNVQYNDNRPGRPSPLKPILYFLKNDPSFSSSPSTTPTSTPSTTALLTSSPESTKAPELLQDITQSNVLDDTANYEFTNEAGTLNPTQTQSPFSQESFY